MLLVWYPKCTTCQRAKAWLDAHGVAAETRDIKLEKPTEEELRRWHAMSGLPLKRFFNTSGLQYKALGLKDKLPGMSEDAQFALLLETMGKRALGAFGATVGVLVVCGLLLGFVEGKSTELLYRLFGWGGVLFTGVAGTPIHELGHYLMCRLFGVRVTEVALFRPVAGRADGVLGYVRYAYDPGSLWQRLGCFFVGIAPMVLGVAAILLILRLITPEVFRSAGTRLAGALGARRGPLALLGAACSGFFSGLFRLRGLGILRGMLCLYLVFSISTHMTLSLADLRGAAAGLAVVAALCLLFGAVSTLLGIEVNAALKKTAVVIASFLAVGLAFALLSLLVSGAAYLLLS